MKIKNFPYFTDTKYIRLFTNADRQTRLVTYPLYMDVWNRHRESENEIGSCTKLYYFFEFKGFSTWGERERHNLSMLTAFTSSALNPTNTRGLWRTKLSGLNEPRQPSHSDTGTQLTAFSQISAHASGAWRHPNTLVPISIWDFYFDISEWHILSTRTWHLC